MNIEIRRNLTLTFSGSIEADEEVINKLIGEQPNLTPEQKALIDQGEQAIRGVEEKIWAYIDEHPTKDLLGDVITRETHLIDFDPQYVERDGMTWVEPKNFYIMPKKSEYEK